MRNCFLKLLFIFPLFTTLIIAQETPFRLDGSHDSVLNFVQQYLPKNPTIIEAGAFDGIDSLRMINKWPKAKLYAFEPVQSAFDKLVNNTKRYKNIHCFKLALGDFTGKANFYVSDYPLNPDFSTAGSSILEPGKDIHFASGMSFPKTEEVSVILLDEWAKQQRINHIDFMWLDMQGYELNMIQNSALVLSTKVIYMEMEFVEAFKGQFLYEDVINWMNQHGFKLVAIDFDPDQPFKKIEPAEIYIPGKAWFGNGVFINTRCFN